MDPMYKGRKLMRALTRRGHTRPRRGGQQGGQGRTDNRIARRPVGFSGSRSTTEPRKSQSAALDDEDDGLKEMVARDGIEPPTPAFSGPRSTTELPGLSADFVAIPARI